MDDVGFEEPDVIFKKKDLIYKDEVFKIAGICMEIHRI